MEMDMLCMKYILFGWLFFICMKILPIRRVSIVLGACNVLK